MGGNPVSVLCLFCARTVTSWHGKSRLWLLIRYSAVTRSPSLDWGYVVLNSSKRHNNTLKPEKLAAEHTQSKLLKTKAGTVGSRPDGEPRSTFPHGILTASLQHTSKWQVTCLVLYPKDKDSPWKNITGSAGRSKSVRLARQRERKTVQVSLHSETFLHEAWSPFVFRAMSFLSWRPLVPEISSILWISDKHSLGL